MGADLIFTDDLATAFSNNNMGHQRQQQYHTHKSSQPLDEMAWNLE